MVCENLEEGATALLLVRLTKATENSIDSLLYLELTSTGPFLGEAAKKGDDGTWKGQGLKAAVWARQELARVTGAAVGSSTQL